MRSSGVLLVDDEVAVLRALSRLLELHAFDVEVASSSRKGLRALQHGQFSVVVCDLWMPAMNGIEFLERARKIAPLTVRILLTAHPDLETAIAAVNRGAVYRFITKPWENTDVIRILNEANEVALGEEETCRLAMTDPLTQTMNMRVFKRRLAEEYARARRYGRPMVSILFVDVDRLKHINDTYGHLLGDRTIVAVAEALQSQSRISDVVCRYGGDEFVILLPETDMREACLKARRIREAVRRISVPCPGEEPITITVSIGVASADTVAPNVDDLLQSADRALYVSKRLGGDKIFVSDGAGGDKVSAIRQKGDGM